MNSSSRSVARAPRATKGRFRRPRAPSLISPAWPARSRWCMLDISLGKTIIPDHAPQQLLRLVIGGELADLEHITFKDRDQFEIVGVYPNYTSALAAWKAKAQQSVDNAHMRYFVVHLHRLLDPGQDTKSSS